MRKRIVKVLAMLFLLSVRLHSAVGLNVELVRKSVVFLYTDDGNGHIDESHPLGTGFLVGIPALSNQRHIYVALVTARHIVDPQWAGCPTPNPTQIWARMNKKNYDAAKNASGVGEILLNLTENGQSAWHKHPDDEVDAAVMFLNAPLFEAYDMAQIPIWAFPTAEEQHSFVEGDAILSAGLIPGATGKKRNFPFFKFGYISSIPDEPFGANCTQDSPSKPKKVWFIAANLVPGNSGSPIFYTPTFGEVIRPMLIGIQSMSMLLWDVAGMTPIQYAYEIIEQVANKDFDLRRGNREEEFRKLQSPK